MNDTTTRCPHCGAGINTVIGSMFNCGNPCAFGTPLRRTTLCREREKSQKLEAEVAELREALEIANRSADDQMFQKRKAEAEVARLQANLRRAIEIAEEFKECIAATFLAGPKSVRRCAEIDAIKASANL